MPPLPGRRLPVSLIIKAPRDLLCIASRNLETSKLLRGRNRLQWSRVRRLYRVNATFIALFMIYRMNNDRYHAAIRDAVAIAHVYYTAR